MLFDVWGGSLSKLLLAAADAGTASVVASREIYVESLQRNFYARV